MKNKNFFYLQYDKINWENQEKTKPKVARKAGFGVKSYIMNISEHCKSRELDYGK